jgi:hypothetical protein
MSFTCSPKRSINIKKYNGDEEIDVEILRDLHLFSPPWIRKIGFWYAVPLCGCVADSPNNWADSNHIRNFRVNPSQVGARKFKNSASKNRDPSNWQRKAIIFFFENGFNNLDQISVICEDNLQNGLPKPRAMFFHRLFWTMFIRTDVSELTFLTFSIHREQIFSLRTYTWQKRSY